jgi:hypothetical protein
MCSDTEQWVKSLSCTPNLETCFKENSGFGVSVTVDVLDTFGDRHLGTDCWALPG